MKQQLLTQNDSNTIVKSKFLRLNGFFVIDSPCIFCDKKIVRTNECYDLILFLDDGGIGLRNVQFRTAILKDDVLTVVVHDTDSNRVHNYTQPFNDESACKWLLVEKNYFKEELQGLRF